MNTDTLAGKFCRLIATRKDATPQTAKLGAWILSAATAAGGFPLQVSLRDIEFGFAAGDERMPPVGVSRVSINASLDWMQQNKVLHVADGEIRPSGRPARLIYWTLQ